MKTNDPFCPPSPESVVKRSSILVVDDEQLVLTLMVRGLRRIGFCVLAASDGRDALQVYRDHRDEIAIVVTDLTMPRMDGLQLIEEIMRSPRPPEIVACSGQDLMLDEVADRWGPQVTRLPKPFGVNELYTAVSTARVRHRANSADPFPPAK